MQAPAPIPQESEGERKEAMKWGERLWRDNMALRDHLRANPEGARRYEQHKRDLVNSGVSSLLEYSQSKEALVVELLCCPGNPRR